MAGLLLKRLAWLLLLAGCYSPPPLVECSVRCNNEQKCPNGLVCEGPGTFCHRPGAPKGGFGQPCCPATPSFTPRCNDGLSCASDTVCTCVEEMTASPMMTCVRKADTTVWCWGSNRNGQLGNRSAPEISPTPFPVELASGQPFEDAEHIESGGEAGHGDFTCMTQPTDPSHASLFCWGTNDLGQLGVNDQVDRDTPIRVDALNGRLDFSATPFATGTTHACAVVDQASRILCWGAGSYGRLGTGDTNGSPVPKPIVWPSGAGAVMALAAGIRHTCTLAQTAAGPRVFCWGLNSSQQLGRDRDPCTVPGDTCCDDSTGMLLSCSKVPVMVAGLEGAEALTAGLTISCALRDDGKVVCWGGGFGFQPAVVRNKMALPLEGVEQVEAGYYHVCARTAAGELFCWGQNGYGQLGDGTITQSTTVAVRASLGQRALDVAAGGGHTCALLADGKVWCWGENDNGELGHISDTTCPTAGLTCTVEPRPVLLSCP